MTYKKETHRSRPAAGGNQQRVAAEKTESTKGMAHFVSQMVGATAACGCAGGDFCPTGR